MASNYKVKYNVDMVFCIDITGSMDNIIDIVRDNALNLYQDVQKFMEKKDRHVDVLRVRIIAYRDYLADNDEAMFTTNFFTLPQDAENLKTCVSCLVAKGGGDDPEDGLEALAYAIKSKWNMDGDKKRHVIVLWTDDDTHDLGFGKTSKNYPKGMASDIRELTAWWGHTKGPGYMDQNAKRFILFAPDMSGWRQVTDNWDKVLHYPSNVKEGLKEVDYSKIISVIAQTI